MTFFNRKEDVLDIQLTQFGKHLLSKGVFKPVFYAFFDDDILYDGAHGGLTEHQNDIEDRIKETPRMRTQHVFHGVESKINTSINFQINRAAAENALDSNEPEITLQQPEPEKHFAGALPLGNSAPGIQNAASFDVRFLKGYFTGSKSISSNSKTPSIRIPQIYSEMIYETYIIDAGPGYEGLSEDPGQFEDSSAIIDIRENFIVLEIEEHNGFRVNKNFEVEVYAVEEKIVDGVATGEEILEPLLFPRVNSVFSVDENNIYSPSNSMQHQSELQFVEEVYEGMLHHRYNPSPWNSSQVEYFFDIEIDSEINPELMCQLKPIEKTKGIFANNIFDCQDEEQEPFQDIYGAQEDYEDPCD